MKGKNIGLALSGGGSRAIAFHLGCLRALDKLGIMEDVKVISTVSGGSIIGVLFALHEGSFLEFENKVKILLKQGFVKSSVCKLFTTDEGIRVLICWVLLLFFNLILPTLFQICQKLLSLIWTDPVFRIRTNITHAPILRFASRTTVLRRVFEDLFQGKSFHDLSKDKPLLVVNATDLRTGSAFYFSQKTSGSWRLGTLAGVDISLGHAVTASSAYPLLLPALDEIFLFERDAEVIQKNRVTLTDGGVYDNLGLGPLWPDRDPSISLNVVDIDSIICCRAGYSLRVDPPRQFFYSRLKGVFLCALDRIQNASTKRLFDLKKAGTLDGFIMPYLGQDDSKLEFPPSHLTTREEVQNYPTNFFGMTEEWIIKLSSRGEQLTLALMAEHYPEQ